MHLTRGGGMADSEAVVWADSEVEGRAEALVEKRAEALVARISHRDAS